MKKKRIQSSNLTLRFYRRDGWSKEELDECCTRGEVKCFFPDDPDPYYTLDHRQHSCFDAKKLMKRMSELIRAFNNYPNDTDEEFIKKMNW